MVPAKLFQHTRLHPLRMWSAICVLIVLLVSGQVAAQQFTFGAKVDLGIAWMPMEPAKTSGWKQRPWLGPQIGGFVKYGFNRKIGVEGQLSFNQIASRMRLSIPRTDVNGAVVGDGYHYLGNRMTAFSLPVMLSIYQSWCKILIGTQLNTIVGSSNRTWSNGLIDGQLPHYVAVYRPLPIKRFDLGLKIGLVTHLAGNFDVEASYYHGLRNLAQSDGRVTVWKVRQLTYGLRYTIHQSQR
jgi:Outer membrane protein beta-barrel domain